MTTKKKDKDHSYGSISNLRDLRAARERVDWELSFRERQLAGRLPSVKTMFSVGNVTSAIARRADEVQALVLAAVNAFDLLRSKFRKGGKDGKDADGGKAGSGDKNPEGSVVLEVRCADRHGHDSGSRKESK